MALRNDGVTAKHTCCVVVVALELVTLSKVVFVGLVAI
jgi:hypothetical protein